MTISEWIRRATEALAESGSPDPRIDALWIAEDILGKTRTELHFEGDSDIDPETEQRMKALLKRRIEGEPAQYILESAYFMGQKFHVDSRVLIPRQDTETMVEAVIVALRAMETPKVLDLCTGSGAIGLSIKALVPDASVTLADISKDALDVAKLNAKSLNLEAEIRHSDLFKGLGKEKFNLIASNPPYIPSEDLKALQREVRYEPMLALDGGADGLDFYRAIVEEAPAHLLPGGMIYLEVGIGEAEQVLSLVTAGIECAGAGIINDLNGIPRIVWARSL
ncbi:MAG: peptide chain release factor N(5)-glutamine methyltransferase [Clostridia bacterium]|nr:peptide chain release factor N(5)-glutamine methyltransferase [Clostridia bacterium]